MVKGEIQTILPCIFDKLCFPIGDSAMNQNDAEIDYYYLIHVQFCIDQ